MTMIKTALKSNLFLVACLLSSAAIAGTLSAEPLLVPHTSITCAGSVGTHVTLRDTIVVCEAEPAGNPIDLEIDAIAMQLEKELMLPTFECDGGDGTGVDTCNPAGNCSKDVRFGGFSHVGPSPLASSASDNASKSDCVSAGATFIDGGEVLGDDTSHAGPFHMCTISWNVTCLRELECKCSGSSGGGDGGGD